MTKVQIFKSIFHSSQRLIYQSSRYVYESAFSKHVFLTNAVISGASSAAGNLVEQYGVEKNKKLNYKKICAFAFFGAINGIAGHFWYKTLDGHRYTRNRAFRQALIGHIIFAPIEYFGFFVFMGYCDNKTKDEIKEELQKKYIFTYLLDCSLYFPFQIVNIKFVPVNLRMSIDSTYSFLWCAMLSYIESNDVNLPFFVPKKVMEKNQQAVVTGPDKV